MSDLPLGDILIDMIKQCMEEKRPIRFLVFETNRGKAPYSLNVTLGAIRHPNDDSQPRPSAAATGGPWNPQVSLPDDEDGEDQDIETEPTPRPVPRPVRRTAPRR